MTPRFTSLLICLSLLPFLTGCGAPPQLGQAYEAYHRGDYSAAIAIAKPLAANDATGEAAYLAGLSAYQLRDGAEAERYLRMAVDRNAPGSPRTSGDAHAMLGRLHADRDQHAAAVNHYTIAASRLAGRDRAQALYYAAISQQAMGQWDAARQNLALARAATNDPAVLAKIDRQSGMIGWTLQFGAYGEEKNARAAFASVAAKAAKLSFGPPRLVAANDSGRRLYLVQLGRFANEAEARSAMARVSGEAIVVPMMATR
jgi:cell division septation protein DedD